MASITSPLRAVRTRRSQQRCCRVARRSAGSPSLLGKQAFVGTSSDGWPWLAAPAAGRDRHLRAGQRRQRCGARRRGRAEPRRPGPHSLAEHTHLHQLEPGYIGGRQGHRGDDRHPGVDRAAHARAHRDDGEERPPHPGPADRYHSRAGEAALDDSAPALPTPRPVRPPLPDQGRDWLDPFRSGGANLGHRVRCRSPVRACGIGVHRRFSSEATWSGASARRRSAGGRGSTPAAAPRVRGRSPTPLGPPSGPPRRCRSLPRPRRGRSPRSPTGTTSRPTWTRRNRRRRRPRRGGDR